MSDNVVLIVLDTVRKDFFDEFTPRLQSLSGVSFEQCRSASSTSIPSHASILTGVLPHKHGIHNFNHDFSHLERGDTFLCNLPEYSALGASANTLVGSSFGFDRVFDTFTDVSRTRRLPEGMDVKEFSMKSDVSGLSFYTNFIKNALGHDHSLKTIANAGLYQIDILMSHLPLPRLLDDGAKVTLKNARQMVAKTSEPFFLFVNLMEAHSPHQHVWNYDDTLHDAPNNWSSLNNINQWDINLNGTGGYERDLEYFRQLYGASIDYLDRKVATFIEKIRKTTQSNTRFIITADHGENLGFESEDYLIGHNSALTESLLHVPLYIVNPPEKYDEPKNRYVSHLELGTLITGLARAEAPDVSADRVPAELVGTTNVPPMVDRERAYWTRMIRCVYEGDAKFVWDSRGECIEYTLDHSKPCWQTVSRKSNTSPPQWARQLFLDDIKSYRRKFDDHADIYENLDDFTKKRLEDLGYL